MPPTFSSRKSFDHQFLARALTALPVADWMPSPNNSFRQGKASRTRTRLPRKLRGPVEVEVLDDEAGAQTFEEDCALGSSGDWDWEWDSDAGKGLGLPSTSGESESGIGIGIVGSGIGIVGEKIGEKIPGYRVSAGKSLSTFLRSDSPFTSQKHTMLSRAEISARLTQVH